MPQSGGERLDVIQVVVVALLQGVTEFLPISSSAHSALLDAVTGWPHHPLAFDVAIHLGSLVAVLAFFRRDLVQFAASLWRYLTDGEADAYVRLFAQVVVATIPIVAMGLLLRDWIEAHPRALFVMGATSIGFAALLWISDTRPDRPTTSEFEIAWRDALLVGCLQVLAIVPGSSRIGIAITAALLLGLSREAAARFACLLAVPTLLGTLTLGTTGVVESRLPIDWSAAVTGFGLSLVVAYGVIGTFVRTIERTGFLPYVAYLVLTGLVLVLLAVTRP